MIFDRIFVRKKAQKETDLNELILHCSYAQLIASSLKATQKEQGYTSCYQDSFHQCLSDNQSLIRLSLQ